MFHDSFIIIAIGLVIGFVMTWGVGANDLANIMSTTMGSKSLSLRQALLIALIFEFAGAVLGGKDVTETIRSGIINTNVLSHSPDILLYGMLTTLLAGAIWMLFASYISMPVSITHTIIGAILGFGVVVLGPAAIHWDTIGKIAFSWVCSPVIAGIVAFLLFMTIKRSVFDVAQPANVVMRRVPIYFFLIGLVLGNMTILKGLTHFGIVLPGWAEVAVTVGAACVIALIGFLLALRIEKPGDVKLHKQYEYIEKVFSLLMAFTACAMIFAHGSNDVALAMGPISAIISIIHHNGQIVAHEFPGWTLWFGCVGVITGLFMYGHKVIETVGSKITDLTPSRAFAATLAGASTVIVSTSTGIPVSATQTLVGGVLGVGLARGISALNLTVVRNIFMSWIITIPVAASLNIGCFYLLRNILGA
jgi:inorganic phosphate transporter, PiT family